MKWKCNINKNNYWVYYVYQVVQNYKEYASIYDVWNEPDNILNHQIIEEWYRQSPNSTDLTHWNSNIFSYIRLLKITYEVVKKFHPEAFLLQED